MRHRSPVCNDLLRGQRKRVSQNKQREYERLRGSIYRHLSSRHDFQKTLDSSLIDLSARLLADWLYVEEILSSQEGRSAIWRYADALAKIHSMLLAVFDQLKVTPKTREKIAQGLVESDEVTEKIKKLLEGN
jgi:hypothetical protein